MSSDDITEATDGLALTLASLFDVAKEFANRMSVGNHPSLLGVTDGKAVGTYVEHSFETLLEETYPDVRIGNSAKGIDLPDSRIECDIKVTSIRQPQSSCPYRDTRQKIYGLGYNLLLFVYEKQDGGPESRLIFHHVALIERHRTADYTLTRMIRNMLDVGANMEDMIALFEDRNLPGDDVTLRQLAEEVLSRPPEQGYLTISNALQWRLQYSHAIVLKNRVEGVSNYDR